ncbi:adhesin [Salmonella enterica subsp. salamae serovar 13,22:z:-]|uniref:AfaD family invasin n=1 Tax=Salmonella enterica TaxID=28901 RepID=UPI0010348927|nr:AfaD family invasin [Salmonella enterica]TBN97381.1 adhesin [Salmonella enterica subsp. salamae serovar 13,22:z:-]
MKKSVLSVFSIAVLMIVTNLSQAAEVTLEAREGMSGSLRDGMRVATGSVVCRENHTGFQIKMNALPVDNSPGHYIVQGRRDKRHEMRVRLGGDGWSVSVAEGQEGVSRPGNGELVIFDVVVDGNQHVAPDEYVYSVSGKCL